MAIFQNSQQLIDVLGGFFNELGQDAQIGPKLLASKLKLRFNYTDPQAVLFVDLSGGQIVIQPGSPNQPAADVEMSMKADTAHKFWQGNVNLVIALARREITAKGPIPKILKLLPIIKPAYEIYPKYLEKIGFGEK